MISKLALPLPGGAATPGLPLLRILKQRGYTRVRLVAHDSAGSLIAQSAPVTRCASFDLYGFLFFVLRRSDVFPGEATELGID